MNSEPSRPASSEPLSLLMRAILKAIVVAVFAGGLFSVVGAVKGWEGTLPGVAAQGTTGAILGVLEGLGFGLACGLFLLGGWGLAYWMSTLNRRIQILVVVLLHIGFVTYGWLSGGWVGVGKIALVYAILTGITFVLYLIKAKEWDPPKSLKENRASRPWPRRSD